MIPLGEVAERQGLDILAATSAKSLCRVQAFIKLADRTERPRVPEIAAALGGE